MWLRDNKSSGELQCIIPIEELVEAGYELEDLQDTNVRNALLTNTIKLSVDQIEGFDITKLRTVSILICTGDRLVGKFEAQVTGCREVGSNDHIGAPTDKDSEDDDLEDDLGTLVYTTNTLDSVIEGLRRLKTIGDFDVTVYKYMGKYAITIDVTQDSGIFVINLMSEFWDTEFQFVPEHATFLTNNIDFLCEENV